MLSSTTLATQQLSVNSHAVGFVIDYRATQIASVYSVVLQHSHPIFPR